MLINQRMFNNWSYTNLISITVAFPAAIKDGLLLIWWGGGGGWGLNKNWLGSAANILGHFYTYVISF